MTPITSSLDYHHEKLTVCITRPLIEITDSEKILAVDRSKERQSEEWVMLERLLLAIAVTFSVYLSVDGEWDQTPNPSVLQLPTFTEQHLSPWQ
jgi:hypothetical protein